MALAAYVAVLAAWSFRTYLRYMPQKKAEEILAKYSKDADRNDALKTLLGAEPPKNLATKDVLKWVEIKSKEKTRVYYFAAYLVTILAVVIVVGMAIRRSIEAPVPHLVIQPVAKKTRSDAPPRLLSNSFDEDKLRFDLYAFRQFHAPLEIYGGLQTVLIVSVSSRTAHRLLTASSCNAS